MRASMSLINSETQFYGQYGTLEGLVSIPEKIHGISFICHPNPTQGGNYTNKVVHSLNSVLLDNGFITVRYNCAGVGNSQGTFSADSDHVQDFISVYKQSIERFVSTRNLSNFLTVFAGFSFGAYLVNRAQGIIRPDLTVYAGLPVGKWPLVGQNSKSFLIHGELDEVIELGAVFDWAHINSVSVCVVPKADHFFSRKLTILKSAVANEVESLLYTHEFEDK